MNLENKEERKALVGKKYFTLRQSGGKGAAVAEITGVGFIGDKLGCKVKLGSIFHTCEIKNNYILLPINERRYLNISLEHDEMKN